MQPAAQRKHARQFPFDSGLLHARTELVVERECFEVVPFSPVEVGQFCVRNRGVLVGVREDVLLLSIPSKRNEGFKHLCGWRATVRLQDSQSFGKASSHFAFGVVKLAEDAGCCLRKR